MSFKTLLYPGFAGTITTKIVCHAQFWFGPNYSSHIYNGEANDSDSGVLNSRGGLIERQSQNMINRGCDVVAVDWYGQGSYQDSVMQKWRANLDNRCSQNGGVCPLLLAMTEDAGTGTGAPTETTFETDLQYVYNNYMNHPSYWKVADHAGCSNRPVFLSFGWPDRGFTDTNWQNVKNWVNSPGGLNVTCNGEPVLGTEGESGLSSPVLDGGYSWVGVDDYSNASPGSPGTLGLSGSGQFNPHLLAGSGGFAVDSWYSVAASHSLQPIRIGSAYAGFNDTNADWGFSSSATNQGRKMSRQCGRVWLTSWSRLTANGFSGTNQIDAMGIPTWDDYEEGTAIEPGIDNCATISDDPISGTNYTFHINFTDATYGTESTIDHYAVFYSTDGTAGQQLNQLTAVASNSANNGTYTINLANYTLPNPTVIYTKAVGKPSIMNHMTTGRPYGPSCSLLSVTPASLAYGSQTVGTTSASQTVSLTNTSSCGTAISSISTSGDFQQTNNCPATLAPNTNCTVNVSFRPTATGVRTGAVMIQDNASGSPHSASLSGTGIALSPVSLTFSAQLPGTTSPTQSTNLTNYGSSTLTISSITVSGDFAQSNNCGTSLAAGATCTINITFTPTVTGTRTGTVSVNDNAGGSPQTASLTGTGANGYAGADALAGWTECADPACTGGNGTATFAFQQNVPTPSLDSGSAQFSLTGGSTGFSNVKWWNQQASVSGSQFTYDLFVRVDNSNAPQAMGFGIAQRTGGFNYHFHYLCDIKASGVWKVWTGSTGNWTSTGIACTAATFPANTWVHLIFHFTRTADNKLLYQDVVVNGTTSSINLPTYVPNSETGVDYIRFYLRQWGDGNTTPYTIWLDNVNLMVQ